VRQRLSGKTDELLLHAISVWTELAMGTGVEVLSASPNIYCTFTSFNLHCPQNRLAFEASVTPLVSFSFIVIMSWSTASSGFELITMGEALPIWSHVESLNCRLK
jgi:hypothetical protein